MKSGRRRRCRTIVFRINRLIAILILQLMGNIGWKRHLSQLIQDFFKDTIIGEFDHPVSILYNIYYFSYKKPVTEADLRTRFCFLARFHQCFPHIICISFQKKHFDLRISSDLVSDKPCRNNLCIIHHQAVSRIQIINNLPENMVFGISGLSVQYQQSGTGTVFQWILCNQFLGKIIIKIM